MTALPSPCPALAQSRRASGPASDRAQALDVGGRRDDRAAHRAGLEAEVLRGAELLKRAGVLARRVGVDPRLARDPRAVRVDRAEEQVRRIAAPLVELGERRIDDLLA